MSLSVSIVVSDPESPQSVAIVVNQGQSETSIYVELPKSKLPTVREFVREARENKNYRGGVTFYQPSNGIVALTRNDDGILLESVRYGDGEVGGIIKIFNESLWLELLGVLLNYYESYQEVEN